MLFKPDCNQLLDLGLLVRHLPGAAVADVTVEDDLKNSHCHTLMDYEVVVRRSCGAATSKFHYNYWISRLRVGANLVPQGLAAGGPIHNNYQDVRIPIGAHNVAGYENFVSQLKDRHSHPNNEIDY